VVGDALSDYDVGWVNLALDGPDAAATAVASLQRLADLEPRVLLPAHGPIPAEPTAAFAAALRRGRRLVDDPDGAIWYGARRIFAFALMIRGGITVAGVDEYLTRRMWLTDAAHLLRTSPESLSSELVESMVRSKAVVVRSGSLFAATEYSAVPRQLLEIPFPRDWESPRR